MPASDAQIRANRENAKKSTGPRDTTASRANALTHGLTATTVLPEREAADVQRRFLAYCAELKPSGQVGLALAMRAATLSARMERCVVYETAMLTDRVRQAEADFVPPEGVVAAVAAKLRDEAGKRALFDDSKEAGLARKYEAAAERGFFRCLKELRQHERGVMAGQEADIDAKLASFSDDEMGDDEFDRMCVELEAEAPPEPGAAARVGSLGVSRGRIDVPITIGKPR
jgi:hypothetical protein